MWLIQANPVQAAPRTAALAYGRGWLKFLAFSRNGELGTASRCGQTTDSRTAPGWLSVWGLVPFIARRGKSLGTEPSLSVESMVRAAPGWLSARPSPIFPENRIAAPGTATRCVKITDSRTASGWLPVRGPVAFMAKCGDFTATDVFSQFMAMARAVSGVFSARPSQNFVAVPADAVADHSEPSEETPGFHHLPVFPAECGDWMKAAPGSFIIDGTLGGGGHSEIFLKAGARVLGIDRDPEALAHARERLASYGDRFSTLEGNFARLLEIPAADRGGLADGLLLDLGVSSHQLDSAARGFSFMREGPLDMRMGPSSSHTAAEIVNQWDESEISRILYEFGEEPKARRISSAIVRQRAVKPLETTTELAACIEAAVGRHGRTHPATRTFQAIRIAVNEELESLAAALAAAPAVLKPGGRLLIITFHSLEDRMVKRFLRHRSSKFLDDPGWPEPRPNPDYQFELLARKAITPTAEETLLNPRARSAKLRVARLLDPTP